jgi:CRISPR/Cas system-associated protein Cas7 (RAMP superfamily)
VIKSEENNEKMKEIDGQIKKNYLKLESKKFLKSKKLKMKYYIQKLKNKFKNEETNFEVFLNKIDWKN